MIRLTKAEIAAIKSSIYKFDSHAKIFLFGSRTDPSKKGGDIDLVVLSQILSNEDRLQIKQELFRYIEEQKVDLIIAKNDSDPFVRIALSKGIQI